MTGSRGFTLIEVLVALGIFGIAALALLKVQGENAIASSAIQERTIAGIVAENRLIEAVLARQVPQMGELSGEVSMAGSTWLWSQTASATADPDLARIDVEVRRVPGGQTLAALTGFRGLK